MRILIVADTYYPDVNGASYFAQRLAEHLIGRGHDVRVLAPATSFQDASSIHNQVPITGIRSVPVLIHKDFRTVLPFGNRRRITRLMRDFAPDIVHFQSHFVLNRTAMAVARALGIPRVGTNHFMPDNLVHYIPAPKSVQDLIARAAWRDFCRVYSSLDLVMTPTESAARKLREVGFTHEIVPVSCGIDLSRFYPRSEKREPRPETTFLFVGRLDKEKNIDLVLQALARVSLPVKFVIAGKGFEAKRLKRIAHELGLANTVSFLGFVPDEELPQLYRSADAFIIAGTAELQSIATMEAMASGLPVIAARAVALPELVHHERNGFLFDPGDAVALARAMETLARDPSLRERMGAESQVIIRSHAIERSVEAYERLYSRVIALARQPRAEAKPLKARLSAFPRLRF